MQIQLVLTMNQKAKQFQKHKMYVLLPAAINGSLNMEKMSGENKLENI